MVTRTLIKLKGVLPTISSYTVFFIICAAADCTIYTLYTLIPFAAVFIHEAGHIALARLCGYKIAAVTFYPVGLDIKLCGAPLGVRAALTDAAGCAANLVCAALCRHIPGDAAALLTLSSLFYAAVNLLPIETLDGGALIMLALTKICPRSARRICRALSFFALIMLWGISVWVLLRTSYNFTLFIMAAYLFAAVFMRRADAEMKD